jgi:integrase
MKDRLSKVRLGKRPPKRTRRPKNKLEEALWDWRKIRMSRLYRHCGTKLESGKRCNSQTCKHADAEWWIDYKDANGVRHRKRMGKDKRVASEILNSTLGNVARREHLGLIADSKISFADFVAKWWEPRCVPTFAPRSAERWKSIIKHHLLPAFPGALRAINAGAVEAYLAQRLKDGAANETVRSEFTVLSHILRRAVSWEQLAKNPLLDGQGQLRPGLSVKTTPGRVRFLTAVETAKLLAVCGRKPLLREFVLLALNTGCRRNEILGLTRKTVDLQNRTISILETKNGEPKTLPLNDVAFAVLKGLPTPLTEDGKLFPFKGPQLSTTFKRYAVRAGIEDFHLHDLRHSFATAHAMAGTSMKGLQTLLGHKTAAMTQRYAHYSDEALRAAAQNISIGTARQA